VEKRKEKKRISNKNELYYYTAAGKGQEAGGGETGDADGPTSRTRLVHLRERDGQTCIAKKAKRGEKETDKTVSHQREREGGWPERYLESIRRERRLVSTSLLFSLLEADATFVIRSLLFFSFLFSSALFEREALLFIFIF
jgi:hypothetical protein